MMKPVMHSFSLFLFLAILISCGSKSNKRAVDPNDLDKVAAEEDANAPKGPARSTLSAADLLEVSECGAAECVQLFMKEKSGDFIHAKKGEFAGLTRSTVTDTTGAEVIIPLSTLYFSTDPGASWRLAHIVHKKELADELMKEFSALGFTLTDSSKYYATRAICYYYRSPQYPGKVLYVSPTYTPFGLKGLYLYCKWKCYVFEVHREN